MNLALFDFDGTITSEDTFTKFIISTTPKARLIIGGFILLPVILLYKLGVLSAPRTRPFVTKVALWKRNVNEINRLSERFVSTYICNVIRKEAQQKLAWHQSQGDVIYVVSASLNIYLEIWCKEQGLNLISSSVGVKNGYLTGKYQNGDCSGFKKVTEIKSHIELSKYDIVYAYGDTVEDLPMLELASVKYYQWYKIEC